MIEMMDWFKRRFAFDLPLWMFPNVVERLRGTASRLEDRVAGISPSRCIRRDGGSWSIQENVGHLFDLEPLWFGRVEDLLSGKDALRPADLENRKTDEADHNTQGMEKLLSAFRMERHQMVDQLDGLDEAAAAASAKHPRLAEPMRLLDLVFFIAEHDDHHLARITEILRH